MKRLRVPVGTHKILLAMSRNSSAELFVLNCRFLSQFRVPGEIRLANLAPPIWRNEVGYS